METVLGVRLRAPVASFRPPRDLNYQRTLPLPPPTALAGIAGAALGLADAELWAGDGPGRVLKVAVLAEGAAGRARDMWTLRKIVSGRIAERSPYLRELLVGAAFTLLYGGPRELLERLAVAFRDPVYPLSLGREDELALVDVDGIELAPARAAAGPVHGTVLPADLRREGARPVLEPGARLEPLVVERLPLAFRVEGGRRHPERYAALSFVPFGTRIQPPPGLALLDWKGRAFAWASAPP